ncbi:uncharacterized protein SCODWIG_00179 [Saccharomycodes ludwigii]|uniref:FAD dependent oxidoreductase domain-containing protein n=1 Tax=Saccharomycodes ludwigii TaxID=36035 RepID=A0A376B155_9ASCO|nr:conserved putative D-amino-acid oxidase [Saccharomycodes ludwigii]KAH3903082.1 conserved putative D-amino-acid oxidase [Saccharomycodes ludwigii]SSD58418.1 uncharacterized protein SCODWIG_00179 [Saccharomycodes ludwigii]
MHSNEKINIVIAGSGVIGLSVCYQLLLSAAKNLPLKITIIAKHFPHDPLSHEYTSPWAGAHFRPFPHKPETFGSDKRESLYTRGTLKFFHELIDKQNRKDSTIEFMKGIDYLESPTKEYINSSAGYNSKTLAKFKPIKGSCLPKNATLGYEYETWCLNAPKYLLFLVKEINRLSSELNIPIVWERKALTKLSDIKALYVTNVDLIFNCTGLGLQWNGGIDVNCYKIRGQTLLISVPKDRKIPYDDCTITYQAKDGKWTFVIKRPNNDDPMDRQFILGGTKQPCDCQTIPRAQDSEELLARGKILYPELFDPSSGKANIKNVNVGFRPARIGGSRVDLEYFNKIGVINVYGFGGMGYEASIGAAQHALCLYNQFLRQNKL